MDMTTTTTRDGPLWLRTSVANVLFGVHAIPDDSVDLLFTSPPYKTKDGWSVELMEQLGQLANRVLKPNGRLFVNFGQLSENFGRALAIPSMIADGSGEPNLRVTQTYIWAKSIAIGDVTHGHLQPINSKRYLAYCWEFIFQLTRHCPRDLDRLAIGVPFMDKSNLTRGTRGKNGDLRDAGDIWYIPYETKGKTKKKAHRYEFPAELVRRVIRVANLLPGSTVLDCFGGSGQTARIAKQEGHNAWLVDQNPAHLEGARQRWSDT